MVAIVGQRSHSAGGQLLANRLEVVDDRPGVSVGVRLTDAELIGAPWIVVVGRRLAEGFVELRDRATGETRCVSVAPDGRPGDGPSEGPALSGNGLVVVFTTSATNLTGGAAARRAAPRSSTT